MGKDIIGNEFTINPKTGMIISDGHEYLNIPRIHEFIRRANTIRESLPEVQAGYTRLWRGNRKKEIGENPSYTNSLEGIALPFLDMYEGDLSYIDISDEDLVKYMIMGGVAENSEFILPADIVKNAILVLSK